MTFSRFSIIFHIDCQGVVPHSSTIEVMAICRVSSLFLKKNNNIVIGQIVAMRSKQNATNYL